jgi:MAF protein
MKKPTSPQLILASGSPRRKELVQLFDWNVEIDSADIDETVGTNENAIDYVTRMATEKAIAAAQKAAPNAIILAADTTVADGDIILGKPQTEAEAITMLTTLRNKTHRVYTAMSIAQNDKIKTICVGSEVPMRNYTNQEIQSYIASGDPFDKAGGYAIQHEGFHPVEEFDDCFANVMGLPICDLAVLSKQFGLEFPSDLPQRCQNSLCYQCTCFSTHLRGTYE